MSRRHSPNLDLYLISEEVEDFPAVESSELGDGGLVVKTKDETVCVFDSGGPHEQIEKIPEAADQVLVTVQNGFLEFQGQDILLYELGEDHEYGELLRQVLNSEAACSHLESEDISKLQDQTCQIIG